MDEIRSFVSALEGDGETAIPLQQGIDVLEMALDIKKSIGF
jgi:hypothetical protein